MKRYAVLAVVFALVASLAWAGSKAVAHPFSLSILMPWHSPPGPFQVPPVAPVAQFTVSGERLDVGAGELQPYAVVEMIHADATVTYQAMAVYGDANHAIFTASGQSPLVADPVQVEAARAALLTRLRAERASGR